MKLHSKIVDQEENFKDATLLLQYFRGQLYLTLNRKIRKESSVEEICGTGYELFLYVGAAVHDSDKRYFLLSASTLSTLVQPYLCTNP
jgi:hypothetical protein